MVMLESLVIYDLMSLDVELNFFSKALRVTTVRLILVSTEFGVIVNKSFRCSLRGNEF